MASLRRMRKKMQKQLVRWTIWGSVFVIFVVGTFSSFSYIERRILGVELPSTIARVNGVKISRATFEQMLGQQIQRERLSISEWTQKKKEVLEQLIDAELQKQIAQELGVRVTRSDFNKWLDDIVQWQLVSARQEFERDKATRDFIRKRYGSLEGLARELREQLRQQREDIEQTILMSKLQDAIRNQVKVTEKDLQDSFTQFRARHIFVSFDRFLPKDKKPSEQDQQEAKKKALEKAKQLRERALKGEDFAELAKKESDDQSTAKRGGDLGEFPLDIARWRLGESATEILPNLKVGDTSEPIEGFTGYHIVKLEGKTVKLPKDYDQIRYSCENKKCNNIWLGSKGEKKCQKCNGEKIKEISTRKKEMLDNLQMGRAHERWNQLMTERRKNARMELLDPELQAIQAIQDGNREQAEQFYREALRITEENPDARQHFLFPEVLHYELSRLYLGDGKLKEAEREVRKALEYSDENDLHLQLGIVLMMQGKKKAALKEFQHVADSSPTYYQRLQLASYFEQLGRKELAEKQRKLAEKEKPKM